MRYRLFSITQLAVLTLVFLPVTVFAETSNLVCSKSGYTILTINGIRTNKDEALENKDKLLDRLPSRYKEEILKVDYVHNPSHLLGIGDIAKAIKQKVEEGSTTDDYDLIEMIKTASEKVATQKLLVVAHSQGNFYANSFYDRVTDKDGGVPVQSIGIYGVATPSDHVAGNGNYFTSTTDEIIAKIVGSLPFFKIMPPQEPIAFKEEDDPDGHSFSKVYLQYKAGRIIGDIEKSLDQLKTNDIQKENEPCINPPKLTLGHKVEGVALAVADTLANVTIIETPKAIHSGGLAVLETGTKVVTGIGNVTAQGVTLVASGVTALGNGVGKVAGGTVTVLADAGKFVGKTIAGAFTSDGEQVAGVAKAIGSDLTVGREDIGNTIDTNGNTENTPPRLADSQSTTIPAPLLSRGGEEETTNPPSSQTKTPPFKKEELSQTTVRKEEEGPPVQAEAPAVVAVETKKVENPPVQKTEPPPLVKEEVKTTSTPATQPSVEQTASVVLASQNSGGQTTRRSGRSDRIAPDAPAVTSPSANATFTTTSVTFVGTAEDASIISSDFSSATVTASGGAWSLSLTLGQGTTTVRFYSTDVAGNTSESASHSVFVDSTSPDVSLTSSTCTGTLSTSVCLVATTSLAFSWSSGASDLAYFNLDRNGTFATTSSLSTSVTGTDEATYTFKVAAVDTRGNVSATSTQAVEVFTQPVVINEVAWAGTSASIADEWVELYNRTSRALSLSTFVFYASDNSPYIPLSGTIDANGYYLIERDDNNTVSTVSADLVANFGTGLDNNGESLMLVVASSTIDTVATCSGGGTSWCAGSDSTYATLERYDASVSGSLSSNWSSNLGYIINGKDANNVNMYGTPRARNNASYYISLASSLSSNKTLTTANSPYLISSTFTIASGVTLTINPGVVIKITSANEPWLLVQGTMNANGTSANPVVFTAYTDDDYGGDTNGDGTATTPSAGYWRRILIDTTSTGSSFTNTLVRYGGNNNDSDTTAKKGSIGVDTATVSFDGLIVEKSNYHGLSLVNSNSTVTNSRFSTSTNSSASASGIYISGGSPTISNSAVSGNYRGITISGATPTLSSNTFTSNSQEAVLNTGIIGNFSGNSGTGNGYNALLISAGTVTSVGATTTLAQNSLPYLIKGTATLASNSTLTFSTGVVVKGWDSTESLYGRISVPSTATLHSSGTTVSDLMFTSMHDSSVGGTTGSYSPSAGQWYGITVDAGGRVHLSGFTLRYAGAGAMLLPTDERIYKGGVKIVGDTTAGSGSIAHALFSNNYQSGLNLDTVSALSLSNVTFQSHTEEGDGTASAIYARSSTSTLSAITFSGNQLDGSGTGTNALTCTGCTPSAPNTTPANLFSP